MAYISVFCFNCSVRLGSIVSGISSIVQTAMPILIILIKGADSLRDTATFVQSHMTEYYREAHFIMFLEFLEKDAQTFIRITLVLSSIYMVTCAVEILGAYKLSKWLLLPYIVIEIFRLIFLLALYCIAMVVIKKKINLGTLISSSVAGAFALLILGYFWICVLSLFQIITIIKTPEYKALYGPDPLHNPILPANSNRIGQSAMLAKRPANFIEKVNFFPSPDFVHAPLKPNNNKGKGFPTDLTEIRAINGVGNQYKSMRITNEYNTMKNNYLKNRTFGYY